MLNEAIYVKLQISSLIHIIYGYCFPLILSTVFTQFVVNILFLFSLPAIMKKTVEHRKLIYIFSLRVCYQS